MTRAIAAVQNRRKNLNPLICTTKFIIDPLKIQYVKVGFEKKQYVTPHTRFLKYPVYQIFYIHYQFFFLILPDFSSKLFDTILIRII